MKQSKAQKVRLGFFVIMGTILFVLAVYLIGQKQNMFKKTFSVNSYFQNVNGLQKGNNVRYAGINIGTVKNISMINDSTINVEMIIEEKIISHIKTDAIATIGSDGLVGNMIVNIVPGKGSTTPISNGDTIDSYSKIGTDDILSTLSVTGENTALLTAKLLKVINALAEGQGTLGVLLNDSIMANDLKRSIKNLKSASYGATSTIQELNNIVASLQTDNQSILGTLLNDSISGQKLKSIVDHLETSSGDIEQTLNQINSVLNGVETSEGAFNYILKDSSLVRDLKSTMENINEGTAKFNENMEALKHNFLTRGYFKKLERQEKKAKKKTR